jgi:hypothetical protein
LFRDTASVFERLVANMEPAEGRLSTSCWVWQKGVCNKNYGFIYIYDPVAAKRTKKYKSRAHRAHIVSWTLANQRPPGDGMTLDHKCYNTRCIRPSHLEEVTRPENSARRFQR